MNDDQLERYSRHILLPQIGLDAQERLLASRVLVIGLGGLGSPIAMYLAAAGVGHLVLSDFDHVDLSNLQRQIIHSVADIGRDKVESARDTMLRLNPTINVTTLGWVLDDDELLDQVQLADVVVDACDNFETRFAVNRLCVQTGTPLVSGAAIRFEGQVGVFDTRNPDAPCYRCLYADTMSGGEACSQIGVFAPLLGIIGSIQACEALKLLAGVGETLAGRIIMVDSLNMEIRTLKLKRDSRCPVCASRASLAAAS